MFEQRINFKNIVLAFVLVLLANCATTKKERLYKYKDFEILEPIVFIKIPTVGIDTGFTKDYIRDFVDILATEKEFNLEPNNSNVSVDYRLKLINDIDRLRDTKKSMQIDLREYGYTPKSTRTMIIMQTGSDTEYESRSVEWKDIALMSLSAIASGGQVMVFPANTSYNSIMRCVVVNNKTQKIEYILYDYGVGPLERDAVEAQVEKVLRKMS
jgi:hypothetical protein